MHKAFQFPCKSNRSFALTVRLIVGAGACALVGCDRGPATVEGIVTFDGQPIEQGAIVFESADGRGASAGGQIADGWYRLSGDGGVPPGMKIVRISAVRKTGRQVPAGTPAPAGTMVDEIQRFIPAIYDRDSQLTCEISTAKTNRCNFELESQGNAP